MNPTNSEVVVVDANLIIAIACNEAGAEPANDAIERCLSSGFTLYAPGVIMAETLYVLCGKLHSGTLTVAEHAESIRDASSILGLIQAPPGGDSSLFLRAEAIRGNYTCRRSADGIYIALAEELAESFKTILLTFDEDMANQVRSAAPKVDVNLLVIPQA